MSKKKIVSRNAAIVLGVTSIVLLACLIGAFAYYVPIVNDKDNAITALKGEVSFLSQPSLTYDFGRIAGNFLGWNVSGYVSNFRNESDSGVTIHTGGVLSRQFESLGSNVSVSLTWTINAVMVIGRLINGSYENFSPVVYSSESSLTFTNATSFGVDTGTTFMVQFEVDITVFPLTYLNGVKLWNCAELS